jgi:8-oxo-dGTP diphosphatase
MRDKRDERDERDKKGIRTPLLAADAVILFEGGIVLVQRDRPPYAGSYALPGGFVEIGESVEAAAIREAREETGLEIELLGLVGVYSDPARDPRGHVVSAAFLALGRGRLQAGSDARAAGVYSRESLPPLAFDHQKIISDALARREALCKAGGGVADDQIKV